MFSGIHQCQRIGQSLGLSVVFLVTFGRTRWGYRFRTRADLMAWQAKKLAKFHCQTVAKMPFYQGFFDQNGVVASSLPVLSKLDFLAHFSDLNRLGLPLATAQSLALQCENARDFKPTLAGGVTVGLSSGTSGCRGVFLVSPTERVLWAGTLLARVLLTRSLRQLLTPWAPKLRVAFFLRANSNLYTTVDSHRLHFLFFDLLHTWQSHLTGLQQFQPHIVIAPASVLHALALAQQQGFLMVEPYQVISVAEVLEPDDEELIRQAWSLPVAQVYQCTEGFLGYTCSAGGLHLNEEMVHVEPEWLDDAQTHFIPRITDFTRQTQVFVRYRLDDVLHVDDRPCSCGRVTRRLRAIAGRHDDTLLLFAQDGSGLRPIFPDVLRRAMLMAQHGFEDYVIEQKDTIWHIRLLEHSQLNEHNDVEAQRMQVNHRQRQVLRELQALWQSLSVEPPTVCFQAWIPSVDAVKRRRIRVLSHPMATTIPREHSENSTILGDER